MPHPTSLAPSNGPDATTEQGHGVSSLTPRAQRLLPRLGKPPPRCVAFTFQISVEPCQYLMCTTHHSLAGILRSPQRFVFIYSPATLVLKFPPFQGTDLWRAAECPRKRRGDELTEEYNSEAPWIDGVISSAFHDDPFRTLEGTTVPLEDTTSHPLLFVDDDHIGPRPRYECQPPRIAPPLPLEHRYCHGAKGQILLIWPSPGQYESGDKMDDTRKRFMLASGLGWVRVAVDKPSDEPPRKGETQRTKLYTLSVLPWISVLIQIRMFLFWWGRL